MDVGAIGRQLAEMQTPRLSLVKRHTYPDLSYKQVGLFFLHGEVGGHGGVKRRVVIVDICDHNVHGGRGRLRGEKCDRNQSYVFYVHNSYYKTVSPQNNHKYAQLHLAKSAANYSMNNL